LRRRPVHAVPLSERFLIDISDAAQIASVSCRTMKRVAAENPELTALVGRRRLFIRAKLEAWLLAGGSARHGRR
jgi:hypothetical protein